MALTKSVLRLTQTEAVVKIAGNGGSATVDLQTDLLASTEALASGNQTVTITAVRHGGENSNTLTITRNGVRVLTLPTETADYIAFDGQELPPENTESTSDIVVAQTGTGYVELYLKLRKVSGYDTKIETGAFGIKDDTTVVGS
jgi:hypothetical protein